jgi:ParB family chromosome partitioning protein
LLSLSAAARQALLDGRISEGHARALLALEPDEQDDILTTIAAGGLSVRQTERLVRRRVRGERGRRAGEADYTVEALEESLRRALGAPVRVRRTGQGVLVRIHFHALEAACRMAEALMPDAATDDPFLDDPV